MARKTVSEDFKDFPKRLTKLMKERTIAENGKERKLRQQDLADYLGVKRQTISLYMTGQSMPDAEQLKNISIYFNVSADYLLGLTDVPTVNTNTRKVCDYVGLSQEAVELLHNMSNNKFKNKPKRPAALDIVNEVIFSASLFNDCVYRSILAAAQYKKVLSRYSQQDIKSFWEKKDLERIDDAFKPIDSIKDGIEVSAGEAAILFRLQAIENIKRAAERVISRYSQEIIPLMTKDCNY